MIVPLGGTDCRNQIRVIFYFFYGATAQIGHGPPHFLEVSRPHPITHSLSLSLSLSL